MLTVQEILLGRGTWAECRRVREPRRTALPHGSQSRVYGEGFVSGFSLDGRSDSGFFLAVHASLCQDRLQQEGCWEVGGHMESPFDLCWTLPVGGGLLVLCPLLGPPVVKITHTNGYYGDWPGWAVSVSVFSLTVPLQANLFLTATSI